MSRSDSSPGLRSWLDRHPAAGTLAAIVLLIVSLTAIAFAVKGPSKQRKGMYYYDLADGTLFVERGGQLTPLTRSDPDNPTGVTAHVFSCSSCDNEADRFIGYLTKHNPQTVERVLQQRGGVADDKFFMMLDLSSNNTLYHAPSTEGEWFAATAQQTRSLLAAARNQCGGSSATPCVP